MSFINNSVCNNAATKRASRRLGHFYDEVFAPCGLRATQYALLEQIFLLGSPSMTVLALALVLDRSALSHTIRPLERSGLIALAPARHDRRIKRVSLTEDGLAKLENARPLWRHAQSRFELCFGADEAATLRKTLDLLSSPTFQLGAGAGR